MADGLYDAPDYLGAMRRNLFPSWSAAPAYKPAPPAQQLPAPVAPQKTQGQLPPSYTQTGSSMTGPYNQQIYPKASDAGFGDSAVYNRMGDYSNFLQQPRYGRDSAPEPGPGMGGVRQDPNRLPSEEEPLQSTQGAKGGRLDKQPQEKPAAFGGLITPEMRPILADMVRRDPSLMQNPRKMGAIIMKLMPFMHKLQQEKYAQARQEHTERMETMAQERAARADRAEEDKLYQERQRFVVGRLDRAENMVIKLSDPTNMVEGKEAMLAKHRADLKSYEDQLQALANERHAAKKEVSPGPGESVFSKGQQGRPSDPAAPQPKDDKPPTLFQLDADDIDKAATAYKSHFAGAKTLAEREQLIRNLFDDTNKALQKQGKQPLSYYDAKRLLAGVGGHDAYDPRSSGKKTVDWLWDSVKSYFPDYDPSNFVIGGGAEVAEKANQLFNPLEMEDTAEQGFSAAMDRRPTTEQMMTKRARSGPERLMGGIQGVMGALGPTAYLAPGATTAGTLIGQAVGDTTENPWLGLGAGLLAGAGHGRLGMGARGGVPMAPQIPRAPNVAGQMSATPGAPATPFAPMGQPHTMPAGDPMTNMMGGLAQPKFGTPPPSGQMRGEGMPGGAWPPAAPPGTPRLPPPGNFPPSRGPMPGSYTGAGETVRPKAGLYGRPPVQGEQRPIEMPPPNAQWRMPPPREPLQLAPPRDPVSQGEAAAEIASGKEPAAPVEAPRQPPQASGGPHGVNQFGEHVVGDTVRFNGRTRVIEELIPTRPGHVAPKARLSGLKLPVTLTKLEPVSMAKAGKFSEGDRVKWDLPAGFGSASGTVQKITVSPRGNAMATVKRSDGKIVDVDISSLKSV